MFGQKGITLVALVITIIVLLILAGVSISVLSGNENNIFNNAQKAVTSYNDKASKTDDLVNRLEILLDQYTTNS